MYTDMVGYTSLGQENESLSLELVDEQRRVIRPVLKKHEGREVKTMGDAFLVEFPSALSAVRCAYDIQRAIREFNLALPEERRLHIRVGIHVGDIIDSEGDISGDAVNVASRIESLAEAGGVCLTRQAYDHVQNKFELPLQSLGSKQLKNVVSPIEVFKMILPWDGQNGVPASFDRRRVAVLPFTNISRDPADEYFSDGMTEEVIATMSRISGLRVIARTSVMGYKGGQKKISDIARELNVGTVLEGSVRKVGDRARITVQLIDSNTSEHLWSESYDREIKDAFAIQTDISKTVAQALKVQLLDKEKAVIDRRKEVNAEAYTLYLKGRYYWNERTKESVETAVKYFDESVKLDPDFALSYSGLADSYTVLGNYAWISPARAAPFAERYARRALELDETLAEAHASLANTLIEHKWDFTKGEEELQRSIELRPNYAIAHHWYSLLFWYVRRHEEALMQERAALEIDPYSRISNMGICVSLGSLGRYRESLEGLRKLIEENPDFPAPHFWKSWDHLFLGELDLAVGEAQKVLALEKSSPFMMLNLAFMYVEAGKKAQAREILDQVVHGIYEEFVRPTFVGLVHLALGDREEGFRWMEKAIEERDTAILTLGGHPWFKEKYLCGPEWTKINRKMGFVEDQYTGRAIKNIHGTSRR